VSSPSGITVAWQAPSYTGGGTIDGYRIQQSSDGGATWTVVGNYTGTSRTIPGASLAPATTYVFRVAAYNTGGDLGAYSAPTSSVSTPGPPNTPNAPTAVVLTSAKQINVSWNVPTGPTPTAYGLEVSSDGGTTWSAPISSATTSLNLTTSNFPALSAGTTYVFRVSASSGWGAGDPSDASIPYPTPTGPAKPATPTIDSPSASVKQLVVRFTPPATGGSPITGYVVERSTDGGSTWTTPQNATSSPATVTASLDADTGYQFRVYAQNVWDDGTPSDGASVTTPSAPGAPTSLTSTRAPDDALDGIDLSWPAVTGASSYRIDRSNRSSNNNNTAPSSCPSFPSTAISRTPTASPDRWPRGSGDNLSANYWYCFRIYGVNAWGASSSFASSGPTRAR
jgi:hypothetical protein